MTRNFLASLGLKLAYEVQCFCIVRGFAAELGKAEKTPSQDGLDVFPLPDSNISLSWLSLSLSLLLVLSTVPTSSGAQ